MVSQSFKSYALLGSGRVAWHFQFYLKSLNLPFVTWSRNADPAFNSFADLSSTDRLQRTIGESSHILFAVRDDALADLSSECKDSGKTLVHFSGAVNIEGVAAAHPLMTFGPQLEELDWYRRIPFVLSEGAQFENILPGLANKSWHVATEQRALYHALCSLAGNATHLLWSNIGDEFEKTLHLPRQLLSPFLHQVVTNLGRPGGFTGPVARGDWQTVGKHLRALDLSPSALQTAYRAYLKLADTEGHQIPTEML